MSTAVPAGSVTGVPAGIWTAGQSRLSSTEMTFGIAVREYPNLAEQSADDQKFFNRGGANCLVAQIAYLLYRRMPFGNCDDKRTAGRTCNGTLTATWRQPSRLPVTAASCRQVADVFYKATATLRYASRRGSRRGNFIRVIRVIRG